MPKKGKHNREQAKGETSQERAQSERVQEAVSVAKDGQIAIRVHAKPGAKQSLVTGK